jgi:hypothetical protein
MFLEAIVSDRTKLLGPHYVLSVTIICQLLATLKTSRLPVRSQLSAAFALQRRQLISIIAQPQQLNLTASMQGFHCFHKAKQLAHIAALP